MSTWGPGPTSDNDPRREAILRHARRRFMAEGYAATRMEPVAREASVSTATLYGYFESKAALFEAVVDDASVDFSNRICQLRFDTLSAKDRLSVFATRYAEFMADPFVLSVFRLVMAERVRFPDMAVRFFERGRGDFGLLLISAIDDMVQAKDLYVPKPSWAAGQLMGMIEHPLFFVPLITGGGLTAQRDCAQIAADAVETFMARYGAPTAH